MAGTPSRCDRTIDAMLPASVPGASERSSRPEGGDEAERRLDRKVKR